MTIRWEIKEESCFCVEKMGRDLAVFWKYLCHKMYLRINESIHWWNLIQFGFFAAWWLLLKVVVEGVSNMSIERRKKNRLSPWIKWYKLNMNWIWNWNWNQNDKNVVDDDWNQKKFFFYLGVFLEEQFHFIEEKKEFGNK